MGCAPSIGQGQPSKKTPKQPPLPAPKPKAPSEASHGPKAPGPAEGKLARPPKADGNTSRPETPTPARTGSSEKLRVFAKAEALPLVDRGVCGLISDELPSSRVVNYTVTNLIGQAKAIKFCCISPDEVKLATGCIRFKAIIIWDLNHNKELLKLEGHDDAVVCGAFSADAKLLVSGSLDNSLAVWDTNTGRTLYKLFGHQSLVCSCCFSHDGTLIVSGSGDNSLIIWNVKTGLPLATLEGHTKIVSCCSISPDGVYILSASADRTIILWETKGGEKSKQIKAHFDVVLSCSYNAEGTRFISNDKRTLKVWDASTCTQIFAMPIQPSSLSPTVVHDGPGEGAKGAGDRRFVLSAFSPDGRNVLFCSNDRTVTLWDPDLGQEVLCLYARQTTAALCAGSCNLIAFGDEGGNVYVLQLRTHVPKTPAIVLPSGID